ncbi:MAG: HAMP domain-containing sensor histidine kinase [Vicinamibacterales bacterium]
MSDAHLAELLGALDLAVFERGTALDLVAIAPLPAWFDRAWGTSRFGVGDALPLDRSAFLRHFLDEAVEWWNERRPGRLSSGPWSESTLDGGLTQFEAMALRAGPRAYLAVERLGARHEQRQAVLQAVRDRNLYLERLMAATEDRFALVDCIVHDLAGPLQGIRGCLSVFEDERGLSDEGRELVQVALRQTEKQETLIADILRQFGPGVASTHDPETGDRYVSDLGACASEVVELMAPSASALGRALELAPSVDPALDSRVSAPVADLERVLVNLVQNALRYAPLGSTVTVDVRGEADAVLASVDDEGAGVDERVRERLFQRRSSGATLGGRAGLGLYFAKRAVESWRGSIGYEPRAVGGTRFWIRIPRADATGPANTR